MTTNYLELPIEGDKVRGHKKTEQAPPAEFEAALRELFAHDVIDAIRWTQYTPYFNDGEACIFGVHTYYGGIRFAGSDEFVNDEDGDEGWYSVLGGQKYVSNRPNPGYHYETVVGTHPEAAEAVKNFYDALNSERHDDLLQDLFGDHAEVTASRDKFSIDFYDHE